MVAAGDRAGWSWEGVEGYGFLALGVLWLELGRRGLVAPRRTSEALGSLLLLSGPEVLDVQGSGPGDWGLWLGLGLAVALIVAGSALRRNVPLGIGAAGMVVFLGQLAGEHWRDLGAPLAILVVGLGLVAAAVVLARLRPAATRPRRRASVEDRGQGVDDAPAVDAVTCPGCPRRRRRSSGRGRRGR